MKRSTIFIIPIIVIFLLLAGAFVWKMIMPTATTPVATLPVVMPNGETAGNSGRPTDAFSNLAVQQVTPIPTPTPASAAALNAAAQGVGDDGGASDLSTLQAQTSGL